MDETKKTKIRIVADTKSKAGAPEITPVLELNKKYLLKNKHIAENENTILLTKDRIIKDKIKIISNKVINLKKHEEDTLVVKGVSKTLGGKAILKNINLKAQPGKIVGLLGPNGSGKTTLFNCIIGNLKADSGKIIHHGEIINDQPIHHRARSGITLLQQERSLFSNMTSFENLCAVLELHMQDQYEIENKANYLLNYFDLGYTKNILASRLSGGEAKRLGILQRMCNKNISTLLLDEPAAALDPLAIEQLKKFIIELKEMNLTILLTDHNVWAVLDFLDYVYLIRDGVVMVEGTAKAVSQDKNAIKYYLGKQFNF